MCGRRVRRSIAKTVSLTACLSFLAGALQTGALVRRAKAAEPVAKAAGAGTTVAVLYFDYAGRDESLAALSKGLAQMLISDLGGVPSLRLVERERLEAVMSELKLAASSKLDARTTARVGKLLGARYLVLGSYFDLGHALRVDARVVDVETGEVVKSDGVNGKPDDFLDVEQSLAGHLRAALEAIPPRLPPKAPSAAPPAAKPAGPRAPRRLPTRTAVVYGRALGAIDAGHRDEARKLLREVVTVQSDFELAQRDLDRLIQ